MQAALQQPTPEHSTLEPSTPQEDTTNLGDEERALRHAVPFSVGPRGSGSSSPDEETELQTRPGSTTSAGGYIKRKTSQLLDAVANKTRRGDRSNSVSPMLAALVEAYFASDIAAEIRRDAEAVSRAQAGTVAPSGNGNGADELPDVAVESILLRGRKRASWSTQFRILSGRAFKNLYRDPALLTAHYTSSIALACEYDDSKQVTHC
jgi:hypothetical protein